MIRSGEAPGIGWSRNMLYLGFSILPRSVVWSANPVSRSDISDVIRLKQNMTHPSKSSVLGALVGCAVGDAMGAPFEGLWADSIPSADSLLSTFHEYHGYLNGQYTDDTQLTLATIRSVVNQQDIVMADVAREIAELWRHQSVIGPGGACTRAAEHYSKWRSFSLFFLEYYSRSSKSQG